MPPCHLEPLEAGAALGLVMWMIPEGDASERQQGDEKILQGNPSGCSMGQKWAGEAEGYDSDLIKYRLIRQGRWGKEPSITDAPHWDGFVPLQCPCHVQKPS